jgi:KDO2-lipid IV(A) lauroyltransferase
MDVKGMIKALRNGDALWYAPDHDYGAHASVFVPYFAVEQAATITGTATLARVKNTVTLPCYNIRTSEGYTLHIGHRWPITPVVTTWPTPPAPTGR